MEFVIDPPIATKIRKMEQRVRWHHSAIKQRGIDQTRLALDDGREDSPEFSFLVLGDSGSGPHRGHNPQRRIAEQMLQHQDECRFVLHTGDVIYLTGSSAYYPANFIEPYREFLIGGEQFKHIAYDRMVFKRPFLPVPGNHDYYDMPLLYGVLSQLTVPLRQLLQSQLDLDVSWRGSVQGNAYARAFMDYLKALKPGVDLERHLDTHYTAKTDTGRCLSYQPGQFTRLPNRYYTFRSGGIDFFALDSNTINAPIPLPDTPVGEKYRRHLEQQRTDVDNQMQEILITLAKLNANDADDAERIDDLQAKLEQLNEVKKDITKQLDSNETTETDLHQLDWLQQKLVESWQNEAVRGRVLFFHHPPYVTEATKWHQAQTLAVRYRLRQVLDAVAATIGECSQGRAIVDLVLCGHAHCLEYLHTLETGHADAHTNWIVCGGSGFSLRRQREEGPDVTEVFGQPGGEERLVARSKLFIGRSGQGLHRRRPYSFIRIDVQPGTPPKFVVRPYVAERFHKQWDDYAIDPFTL
ncbi:MAG: metallophosphoesterase [Stenomitos rutilans HA7619-LM2]|jgi:3',5'-cyclic AMP phosphodiesterase CpdA|nr:metallophosphoesterase [Stenomitos rutilans HA7619-LM2]